MKTTYAAVILLAALIIFCAVFGNTVKSDVASISEKTDKMRYYTQCGNYSEALKYFELLKKEWREKEIYLQIMTEHGELDLINEQLAAIEASYKNNEFGSIFQYIYTLDYFINHIYEKKTVNIATIL